MSRWLGAKLSSGLGGIDLQQWKSKVNVLLPGDGGRAINLFFEKFYSRLKRAGVHGCKVDGQAILSMAANGIGTSTSSISNREGVKLHPHLSSSAVLKDEERGGNIGRSSRIMHSYLHAIYNAAKECFEHNAHGTSEDRLRAPSIFWTLSAVYKIEPQIAECKCLPYCSTFYKKRNNASCVDQLRPEAPRKSPCRHNLSSTGYAFADATVGHPGNTFIRPVKGEASVRLLHCMSCSTSGGVWQNAHTLIFRSSDDHKAPLVSRR